MQHQQKILKIYFNLELSQRQVSQLRGAINAKIDVKKHLLFHNHLPDESFRYGYPLIQYRSYRKKALVICLGKGVEEIQHLLMRNDWHIQLGEKEVPLHIENMKLELIPHEITDEPSYTYRMHNWLSRTFDFQTYKHLKQELSLLERIQLIEGKMVNNLVEYAKGVGLPLDIPIQCHLMSIDRDGEKVKEKINMAAFGFTFRTNIKLPLHIGLGKAAARGFGTIYSAEQRVFEQKRPRLQASASC
ncbi:MAG: CRISPR-associated endonuclease Cas6 [Flammeovirgaceae bacterium]